jgi:hypothetical protein
MLEQVLRSVIPSRFDMFPKLTPGRDPYHFDSWDKERRTGRAVLRYWFWNRGRTKKNRKRVFVGEIETLLRRAYHTGTINRGDFNTCCPRTNSDGGCGFAVIIGILDFFRVVSRRGRGMYDVVDRDTLLKLMGGQ